MKNKYSSFLILFCQNDKEIPNQVVLYIFFDTVYLPVLVHMYDIQYKE